MPSPVNNVECLTDANKLMSLTFITIMSPFHSHLLLLCVVEPVERVNAQVIAPPQIGRQNLVALAQRQKARHNKVARRPRLSRGSAVHVLDARHRQHLLRHRGGHQTRSARRGNQPNSARPAFARQFARHSVGRAQLRAPVPFADGHQRQLRQNVRAANGNAHLGGALLTESDVRTEVAHGHPRLETRALPRRGLLLHGLDLHNLVLQLHAALSALGEVVIDDLGLFDADRVQENVGDGREFAIHYEAAEFGGRHPLLLGTASTATTATTAASATTTKTATTAASSASTKSTATSSESASASSS